MAALALVTAGLAGGLLGVSQANAVSTSHPLGWELGIPNVGVAAPVIKLGGPRSGAIAVPTFAQVWDVGWYRYGAIPGQRGNAVLLGHVDTYAGPAVFYNLYKLLPGDQVEVDLGHHDIRRFTVHWVKEVLKTHFPASKVFGPTDGTHLWLVTCGGQFDYSTRSYLSNIIVYTTANVHHVRPHHEHHVDSRKPHTVRPDKSSPVSGRGNRLPLPAANTKPGAKTTKAPSAGQPSDVAPTLGVDLVPPSRLIPPIVPSSQH
jgi:Sortase domain